MDKLKKFQESIKAVQQIYAKLEPKGYEEYQTQVIADDKNGHYFLIRMGWKEHDRLHALVFHIDIIKDKIWIQKDQTEYSVAQELVDMGLEKQDIVLAYQAPYRRPISGFAIA